jgi:hypothetical protein
MTAKRIRIALFLLAAVAGALAACHGGEHKPVIEKSLPGDRGGGNGGGGY